MDNIKIIEQELDVNDIEKLNVDSIKANKDIIAIKPISNKLTDIEFDLEVEREAHSDEFFEQCRIYHTKQKNATAVKIEALVGTQDPTFVRDTRMRYLESIIRDGFKTLKILKEDPNDEIGLKADRITKQQDKLNKWYKEFKLLTNNDKNEIYDKRNKLTERCRKIPIENLVEGKIIENGDRKKTICPIHKEKTPSLMIYENNSWHCFGCQANGQNAIDFVMEWKKINFNQALEHLRNI